MKKKALLLAILSSMALATTGFVVALSAGELGFLGSKAGTVIPGELSYSYTTVGHKTISSLKHSFLKTTSNGTNIYFYSYNNNSLNGKLVASLGGSLYADDRYFTFTSDEDGATPFIFQNVTSLSITSASSSDSSASFSIYTSKNAASASYSGTIAAGETKVISEIAGATYIKLVPTSSSWLDISNVTINYSCDPEVQPGEKVLTGIRVKDDYKRNYAVGSSFVEPTVYADYVQDEVETSEIVSAEFSGYKMNELGAQTVTASFGGKTAEFDIHVKPTEVSKLITYQGYSYEFGTQHVETSYFLDLENSDLPAYGEPGESLSFTPVFKSGFSYYDVYEDKSHVDTFIESAGVVTFTVPSFYDVDVVIVYDEEYSLDRMYVSEPKTEYTVGSSFVIPTVVGVYVNPNDDEFEYELTVTASNFSGFNSETAVASQTITVSYPGVDNVQYTISIVEPSGDYLEGVYVLNYDSSIKWKLEFNSDGTGVYRKYNASSEVIGTDTFSYEFDGTNLTFTNVTCAYNNWGNYYLTYGTTATNRTSTNSGTVSGDVISITTYNTSGSVTRAATYTLAA